MSECLGRLLQPYSERLHQIALLSPDSNDIIEFKGGQWTARSPGEYWVDLLADPTVQASTPQFSGLSIDSTSTVNSNRPSVVIRKLVTGTTSAHGFADNSDLALTASVGYNCFDARVDVSGSNNYDHLNCFQAYPNYASSGTMLEAIGFVSTPVMNGGTITRLAHFQASDTTGASVVNTQYGLYIDELVKGGNNFAIFSDGETVSRMGPTGFGTSSPENRVHAYIVGGECRIVSETGDTNSSGFRWKSNTSLRFDLAVPSSSSALVLSDAGGNAIFEVGQSGPFTFFEDITVTRIAPVIAIDGVGVTSATLQLNTNGSTRWIMQAPTASADLVWRDGSLTERLRLVNGGGLQTDAPSGGTAQPWKLGEAASGAPTPDYKVRIQVGSQVFLVAAELVP